MPPETIDQSPAHQAAADITGNDFPPRYLAAKKEIDDRSLNHHVWETLRRSLAQAAGPEPVNILEIGAGIGTMLQRVVERGLLAGPATYVASDSDAGHLRSARRHLSQWAQTQGHALSWSAQNHGRLQTAGADVALELMHARAEELTVRSDGLGPLHLLIAHAVLDLLDFAALLPRLLTRLTNSGLAYLTGNFDGETLFLPDCEEDPEIIRRYHTSMELRLTGASHTGRNLLRLLQRPGLELLAAGSSDWVIHPRNGGYAPEEIFFLHTIIATVEREVAGQTNPPPGLAAWARLRHRQVDNGELSLLASHLDFLARRQGALP
jgi:hypothetical protein